MNGNGFLPPNDYKNVSPEAKKWALINALMAFGGGLLGRSRYSTVPQTAGENIGPALMEGMGAYGGTLGNAYGMQQDQQDREMKKQMFDLDRQKTQAEIEHLKQPKQPSIADLLNLQKYNDMVEQRKGYPQTVANFLDDKPDMWGNAGVLASMQPEQGSKLIEEYLKNKMLPKEEETTEIKNYKFGQKDPNFSKHQKDLKAAGASKTNLNIDTKRDTELIKGTIQELPKLKKEATTATTIKKQITTALEFLNKGVTGKGGQFKAFLAPYAEMLGYKGENLSDAQTFQLLTRAIIGPMRLEIVGPGPVSEWEQQLMQQISGGGGASAQAAKQLLDHWQTLAQRKVDNYNDTVKGLSTIYPNVLSVYPKLDDEGKKTQGDKPDLRQKYGY